MMRSMLLLVSSIGLAIGLQTAAQATQNAPSTEGGAVSNAIRGPIRSGFTLNLSLGAGSFVVSPESGTGKTYWGLGGLNLGLGGFINPTVAVLFYIQGGNFGPFNEGELKIGVGGTAGPAVQVWLGDRLYLLGGLGIGFIQMTDALGGTLADKAGLGVFAQVGVSLLALTHHALGVYAGFSALATGSTKLAVPQFGLVWQYH